MRKVDAKRPAKSDHRVSIYGNTACIIPDGVRAEFISVDEYAMALIEGRISRVYRVVKISSIETFRTSLCA